MWYVHYSCYFFCFCSCVRDRGVSGKFQATAREVDTSVPLDREPGLDIPMFEDEELELGIDLFMNHFGTLDNRQATGSPSSFSSFSPIVSPQDRNKTCGDPTQFPIDTSITATSPVELEDEFASKPAQSSDADPDEQGDYALVRTQTMCYSPEDAADIARCTAQVSGLASTSQSSRARQPPRADTNSSSSSSDDELSEEEEEAITMNVKVATSKNGLGEEGVATVVVVLEYGIALGSSNCDRLPDGSGTFLNSVKSKVIACLPRLIAEGLDISRGAIKCPRSNAYVYSVIDESSSRAKKKKFVMKPLDTQKSFRFALARNDDDFGVVFVPADDTQGTLEVVHRNGGVPRTDGTPTILEGGSLSSRIVVCSFAHRNLRGTRTDFKLTKETSQVDSSADGDWDCLDDLLEKVNKKLLESKRHLVSGEVLAYKSCNEDGSVVRGM